MKTAPTVGWLNDNGMQQW